MRINPIINHSYSNGTRAKMLSNSVSPSFQGKHDALKILSTTFGGVATVGAAVGTILISGGVALPFVAAYGALGALTGAGIGHMLDKGGEEKKD